VIQIDAPSTAKTLAEYRVISLSASSVVEGGVLKYQIPA
jgi:hypothetical protein